MPAPRSRVTCRQASENRSCHSRRRGCDTGGSSGPDGSSSAHTTTTGRSRSQPKPAACSSTYAGSPARPEEDVAEEVAAVLVLDRRHGLLAGDHQRGDGRRPLQRVHVVRADGRRGRAHQPGQVGARRPRSGAPAAPRRRAGSPPRSRARRAAGRWGRPDRRCASAARRSGDIPPAARSRPSVEVTRMPTPSTPATSAAIRSRSPPSRTDWVRAVCSASTRARAAAASSLVNNVHLSGRFVGRSPHRSP